MAKVINPLLSGSASGQFGHSMTFDKRGYVRQYVIPANPNSVGQQGVRGKLGDIQRTLKFLGVTLRATVKAQLGYRWNSLIISELTANNGARWTTLSTAFTAFTSQEKTDWATANPGSGFVNDEGLAMYATCTALYDVCLRIAGDGNITQPTNANSATVGGEFIV